MRAGLEKAGVRKALDDVQDSDVLDEAASPDPKGRARSAAGKSSSAPAAEDKDKVAPPGGKTAETAEEAERSRPQPRYDSKSFNKWVSNNPEQAAELVAKVFKTELGANADGWKKHFVAFENKRRRQSEADEKQLSEIESSKAEVERLAKEAREPIEGIISLIEAEQKEDFPAIDRFIKETFGCEFEDYCRRRLRGINKETPTERAQKQKIAALEAKLAEKDKPAEAEPEKEAAPKVSQKWVEREVGSDHGVRDLADWQKRVSEAYEESRDDDGDYGITIEDAADQVLDAFLKKRGSPAAATAPGKTRPRSPQRRAAAAAREPAKTWTDDDEDSERSPSSDVNTDFSARLRNALDRAGRRAG